VACIVDVAAVVVVEGVLMVDGRLVADVEVSEGHGKVAVEKIKLY